MTQKLIAFTFLALAGLLFAGCASTTETTTTTTRTREQSSMYAR
jgi:outer membrane biogenesis lipoprotein LolB